MKKFLIRLISYILIVGVVVAAVNFIYVNKKNSISSEAKYIAVPYGIELCSFGSSHGNKGYNFEDYSDERICFNFALNSQRVVYDDRILKTYIDHINPGAVVLITVSFTSLIGKPFTEDPEFLSQNRRYYSILPDNMVLQYDSRTDFYMNYLPAAVDFEDTMKVLLGVSEDQNKIWLRTTSAEKAEEDAHKAYKRHFVDNKQDESGNLIVNNESVESIYSMINTCHQHDLKPILVTIPCLKEYNLEIERNNPKIFDICYGIIEQIQAETGVEYCDYSSDERFYGRYNLFTNSDHLNREGAKLFTEFLLKENGIV